MAHPNAIALTAMCWQEGEPLRFAVARLRAAAVTGLATVTVLTLIPVAAVNASVPASTDLSSTAIQALSPRALSPEALSSVALSVPGLTGALDAHSMGTQLALAGIPATVVTTTASRVIAFARTHLYAPYRWGASGPTYFDCSGLVLRVFSQAGLVSRLGGWGNRSGYAMLAWFRSRHLASRTNGKPGDVVVYGGGAHVGIYLGNGKVISALVEGVRIHGLYALTNGFTAFLHTGLTSSQAQSVSGSTVSSNARYTKVAAILRSGAGTSYARLRIVAAGTLIRVLASRRDSHDRTWYQVKVGTRIGWLAGWLTTR